MSKSKSLVSALATAALLVAQAPGYAFDTFWHSAASAGAGQQHHFSDDAVNILQFGTFGPDFFGPLFDSVINKTIGRFVDFRNKAIQPRKAGIFMHFDNLNGELDRDWKIDYLFRRELENTRRTIALYYNSSETEGKRKILILLALGSSLHMIEDFYSHTNWAHFDFVSLGFPQEKSIWKQDYAPSWFQVVDKLGPPAFDSPAETWPIEVRSGIYPPPKSAPPKDQFGVPLDHALMNHDNSQLFYEGASRVKSHAFGPHATLKGSTAEQHQLYAINSAAMAAIEWIDLVEQDPNARRAIEWAHDWNLKKFNPASQKDLESALASVLMMSCVMDKWDGDNPPPARKNQCKAFNYGMLPNPFNEYWAGFATGSVLENLTKGIGDQSGHYTFDQAWYKAHRPKDKAQITLDLDDLGLQVDVPGDTKIQSSSSTKVVLTSPKLGTMEIAESAPQTIEQAKQQAQKDGGSQVEPSSTDPQDYQLVYRIPSGFKSTGQRKIGQHTYGCGGTGTQDQAHAIADACKGLHVLAE